MDDRSYRLAKAIAAQGGRSLGSVVAEAVAAYYGSPDKPSASIGRSSAGFPTVTIGRSITAEDVADLENE